MDLHTCIPGNSKTLNDKSLCVLGFQGLTEGCSRRLGNNDPSRDNSLLRSSNLSRNSRAGEIFNVSDRSAQSEAGMMRILEAPPPAAIGEAGGAGVIGAR